MTWAGAVARPAASWWLPDYLVWTRFMAAGALAGIVATLALSSMMAGLAFFALFAMVGVVWRQSESPVLAFCLAYQWIFATTGFFYSTIVGHFPTYDMPGDSQRAVLFSILGLLTLALGVRVGWTFAPGELRRRRSVGAEGSFRYRLSRIFWVTVALYAVDFGVEIIPAVISATGGQIIHRLLEFRMIFLALLLLLVLRHRQGYRYGAIALLVATIPSLGSVLAVSKEPLFLLLILALGEWQRRRWAARAVGRVRPWAWLPAAALGCLLLIMGLAWEGAIKPVWRAAVHAGQIQGTPVERSLILMSEAPRLVRQMRWDLAAEALAARVSSGAFYFSHVVNRVPDHVPHENGSLTMRAVRHVTMPRILFPDKPSLGSASWMIIRYAGLPAAGAEEGTSIGLTYIAEFYIDYGSPGFLIPLFLVGIMFAVMLAVLSRVAPSSEFYVATATVVFLLHFTSFDGELVKMFGGLIQSFLVGVTLLWIAGGRIHEWLRPATGVPGAGGGSKVSRPA